MPEDERVRKIGATEQRTVLGQPAPKPIELGHPPPPRKGSAAEARYLARIGGALPRASRAAIPTGGHVGQPAPVGYHAAQRMSWEKECRLEVQHVPAYPVPEDRRFPPRTKDPARSQERAECAWNGPITIACVLRRGPDFGRGEVNRLYRGVKENLTKPFRFVVLTDDHGPFDEGVEIAPLAHPEWTTKHSKLELFRPENLATFGRTVYFDLDTVICGNLDDLVTYDGSFAMLRDFFYSLMNGSGMMAWGGDAAMDLSEIYFDFLELSPAERMRRYPIGGGKGDQLFIRHHTPIAPHQIQDCFPGQVGSYKAHFRGRPQPLPPLAVPRVICFHGKPKPSQISEGWIRRYYDRHA